MATPSTTKAEQERAAYLLDAQSKAAALFEEIGRDLVRSGISEKTLSNEIHALATKRHNIRTYWHKRVVRSGPNTLLPYKENVPDRIIQPDDILFVDLGPVFEAWEADLGRTFALGDDPVRKDLRDSLEPVWNKVKARFMRIEDITGEELYHIACEEAKKAGWESGGQIADIWLGIFRMRGYQMTRLRYISQKGTRSGCERKARMG